MGLSSFHMKAGCHIRSCTESWSCAPTFSHSKLSKREENPRHPEKRICSSFPVSSSRNILSRSISSLQRTRGIQLARSSPSLSVPPTMDESPSSLTPTKDEKMSAEESFYPPQFRLLFVEMGVGYDQHGWDDRISYMAILLPRTYNLRFAYIGDKGMTTSIPCDWCCRDTLHDFLSVPHGYPSP